MKKLLPVFIFLAIFNGCEKKIGEKKKKLKKLETIVVNGIKINIPRICSSENPAACLDYAKSLSSKNNKNNILLKTALNLKACEWGLPKGCAKAGANYLLLSLPKKAKPILNKACTLKDGLGCYKLASIYTKKGSPIETKIKGITLYEKSCGLNYLPGCYNAASFYSLGEGVKKDINKALKYYGKACQGGDGESCYNLGIMYDQGEGGKKLPKKALKSFIVACEKGVSFGCYNAGIYFDKGEGGEKNKKKAVLYFEKACNLKNPRGCYDSGVILTMGEGIKSDEKHATALFDSGCKLKHSPSCYFFALNLKNRPEKLSFAISTLKNLCGNKFLPGCRELIKIYEKKKNRKDALYFMKKSCLLKGAKECFSLGKMYSHKNNKTSKDIALGIFYYKKACSYKSTKACLVIAKRYVKGRGVKKDFKKAAEFFDKACNLGDGKICFSLGTIELKKKHPNKANALNYYRKACDSDFKKGCTNSRYLERKLKIKVMSKNSENQKKK